MNQETIQRGIGGRFASHASDEVSGSQRLRRSLAAAGATSLAITLTILLSVLLNLSNTLPAQASTGGVLTVSIHAGYNLVVDSNVLAPSTYAPSVATVVGEFCNTGTGPLENVVGYIGDYSNIVPSASTYGTYPARDSATFATTHPLYNTGIYSYTHVGGTLGKNDARRNIGTIPAGECRYQYWHFTYPRRSNGGAGFTVPNTGNTPVWGATNDPNDDLQLAFDVWGSGTAASTIYASSTWTMTMRNEISAMANKIYPNGSDWFTTNVSTVHPGDVITTNGVLYELGVINQGFDNNGDGLPDYNAWLQPIGDTSYDPSCFRIIRTTAVLTVSRSGGNPDLILTQTDNLYFTNLPDDNNGVIGEVHYVFLSLGGPCSITLSPYQEAASGSDNEKFSGDYGTPGPTPPMESYAPSVSIDKTGNAAISPGASIAYQIPITNTGTVGAGLTLSSMGGTSVGGVDDVWMPVVISDSIPAGLQYVTGTATATFTSTGVILYYSTDSGSTFTTTEPTPAKNVTTIQWWLTNTLAPGDAGRVYYSATVPVTYSSAYVTNCAGGQFGDSPSFGSDCVTTIVSGTNKIGDTVWQDDNANGVQDVGESGISGVDVGLYLDVNANGAYDSSDLFIITQTTNASGVYTFTYLPNASFIAMVDTNDSSLPYGYNLTTQSSFTTTFTVSNSSYLSADYGFGPALSLNKTLVTTPTKEANTIFYQITLTNTQPGDGGSSAGTCAYNLWAGTQAINATNPKLPGTNWVTPANVFNTSGPDSLYGTVTPANASDKVRGGGYSLSQTPVGNITAVKVRYNLYNSAAFVDDTFGGELYSTALSNTNTALTSTTFTIGQMNVFSGTANKGYLLWDVTAYSSSWALASILDLVVDFNTQKGGGAGDASINLDAMGIQFTTNGTCNNSDDTLDPVPLTDTFNASQLQFISATVSPASVTTTTSPYANTGVIKWTNVGPLTAGSSTVITVAFKALEPTGNITTTMTNTARVDSATFVTGKPANTGISTVTAQLRPTAKIGDILWNDNGDGGGTSGNGIQDGGEDGIPGANLWLCSDTSCNTKLLTATTTITGYYYFEGLDAGTYTVMVITSSLPGPTTTGTLTQTGDPNFPGVACVGAQCDHKTTLVLTTTDVLTADFGYQITNFVYGYVWQDMNGDGAQATGDSAFVGISVTLVNSSTNVPIYTTTTDANGFYGFNLTTTLPDGNYYVKVLTTTLPTLSAGGSWSQTVDPDVTKDSRTIGLVVSGGNIYGSYDFAYTSIGTYQIGDTLYYDWNYNGTQDSAEGGIANITVYLYEDSNKDGVIDIEDALISTTTTNASGTYLFSNLAGSVSGLGYLVVISTSDTDFPTPTYATQDPNESGLCSVCDDKSPVTLTTASNLTNDFGYHPYGTASIGDLLWVDTNGNGIKDSTESGITASVTISLYVDNGDGSFSVNTDALVTKTTNSSSGAYLFEDLPISYTYWVYISSTDANLPKDSYGNFYKLTTGNDPYKVVMSTTTSVLTADFGFAPGAYIGDFVWRDDNADGNVGANEPGIDGITVTLYIDVDNNGIYSAGDTAVSTTTTKSGGYYSFTSLSAYTYVVKIITTTTYPTITYDLNSEGSGVFPRDGQAYVKASPGQTILSLDFGLQTTFGTIGDRLWVDLDGNNVFTTSEQGLSGIVISLTSSLTSTVVTQTTDSDGYYAFGGLSPGTYTATYSSLSIPSTLSQTFENDGTLNRQISTTIATSGQSFLNADFAYVPLLTFTKTATVASSPVNGGDSITYTLVVSNPSSYIVKKAGITDSVPANTNYVAGSVSITPTSAGVTTSFPSTLYPLTITAGSRITATFRVTVTTPPSVSTITNTAQFTTPYNITYTASVTTPVALADLALTKTVTPSTGSMGDTFTFTVVLTNSGPNTATGVVVTDLLPSGLNYITSTATQGSYTTTAKLWTVGTLTNNTTVTLTLVTTATAIGTYTNTAEVYASNARDADSTPNNGSSSEDDQGSATVTVIQGADVQVTKSDTPDPVTPGGTVTYTIVVTNAGPASAANVNVTDTLPSGVTFITATMPFSSTTPPAWFLGTLTVNATRTLTVVVTAPNSSPTGTLTNTVTVTTTSTDITPGNNTFTATTTITSTPGLQFTPNNSGSGTPGQTLTYIHQITNTGNFTDTFTLTQTVTNGFTTTVSTTTVTLPPNTSTPITVNVTIPGSAISGTVSTAVFTATSTLSPTLTATVTDTTTATNTPGLQFTPNNSGSGTPGQTLTYTHQITNTGNFTDTFTLTQTVTNGFTTTVNTTTVTLPPNTSTPIAVNVTIPGSAISGTVSTAVFTATSTLSPTLTATVTDTTTATNTPGLQFTPNNSGSGIPGQTLTYTHQITNTGNFTDTFTLTQTVTNGFTTTVSTTTVTLPPNGGTSITVVVTIPLTATNGLTSTTLLTATSTLSPTLMVTVTDTTTVNLTAVDVLVTKSDTPDPVTPGGTLTYTIVVTNTGPTNAANVFVTDTLPSGVMFVTATTPLSSTTPPVWFLGTLTVNATQTLTVVVTAPNSSPTGTLTNTVTVTTTSSDTNPSNDTFTATTTIAATPGLQFTPNNSGSGTPGQTLTYTHQITNTGDFTDTFTLTQTVTNGFTTTVTTTTVTLPPNGTTPITVNVTIPGSAISGAVSTATFTATSTISPTLTKTVTDTTTVTGTPAFTFTPNNSGSGTPGQTLTYTHRITNTGNVTDTYTLTFTVTNGFTTTVNTTTVTLPPNGTTPITVNVTIPPSAISGTVSIATITATSTISPALTVTRTDTTTVTVNSADVSVTKTDGTDPVLAGSMLTYTLVVSNAGPANAANVVTTDTLPTGVTFGSANPTQTGVSGSVVNWSLGTVNANTTRTIVVTVTVNAGTSGVITNTAVVTTTTPDPNPTNNTSTVTTTVTQSADLIITKSVTPTTVAAGGTLTYTLVVSNAGPSNAANVVVTDTLPVSLTFGSATPSASGNVGQVYFWNLGTVNFNSTRTITLTVTVSSAASGSLTNTAVVTSTTPDPNPGNNPGTTPVTVTVPVADLIITKSVTPTTVVAGNTLTYTLVVSNAGPADAANVVVTDTLPATLIFGSATPSASGNVGQAFFWNLGTVNANSTRTIILTALVTGTASGNLANTAVVTSTTPDPNPGNNPGTVTTTVTPALPGIAISKIRLSPDPAHVTELVTFSIRLTNTGNTTLVSIPLTDVYDSAYLLFAGATPAPTSVNPSLSATTGQLTWADVTAALGDLPPGASFQITTVFTAITPTPPGSPAFNFAGVNNARDTGGNTPPGGTATGIASVTILPNISLLKNVFAPGPFLVGDEITFTIYITNEGRTTMVVLPLLDDYDTRYLAFKRAIPTHNSATPGQITWNDLTTFFGDVPPGGSISVDVVFDALAPITTTINMATATNMVDNLGNRASAISGASVQIIAPTAVSLLYFRVTSVNASTVSLDWATAKEIDNYGFNLYRAPVNDFAQATLIHFEPSAITGGNGAGTTYHFTDTPPAGQWWYWLTDVDTQGLETWHEPETIVLVAANAHRLYLPLVVR